MSGKPTVLCIVGPTATGKTALSVEIAKRKNGEIVSADAVSVYRGLDIGSAKPSVSERQGIPHHVLDCVDLRDSSFSVSVFREMARRAIDSIVSRGNLPIVVGGSGLYADAIFSDMRFSAPSDPSIRAELEGEYDLDQTALFSLLRSSDPVTAARLHPNDKKRVVRALEVIRLTGKPFSDLNHDFSTAQESDGTYHVIKVGLTMSREMLYARIDARVDAMMGNGLRQEAFALFENNFTPECCTGMMSIGYAQLYECYCGRCTETEAIAQIKLATRHFAKRQITWFKRDPNTIWFDVSKTDREQIVNGILELL